MKRYRRMLIMLGVMLLLGVTLAALDGRISSLYFSLETISAVLFTVSYFFGADVSENKTENFFSAVGAVGVPVALWTLILRSGDYFGYTGEKITMAAFFCGGVIFAFSLLTRHQTGPLRAAFGRNMLPAFFGAAAFARLIPYIKDAGFVLNFKDKLCFDGVLLLIFAIGVFIGANRKLLAKGEAYVALLVWVGVFAGLLFAGSQLDKSLMPILFTE
ncbi:MAG: hypothetical protein IJ561_07265 [Ruminococcus sp.]|nr:hypothetical protein [Ruminococcus sp.]